MQHRQLYLVSIQDRKFPYEREDVSIRAYDCEDAKDGIYEIRDMDHQDVTGVRRMTQRDIEALDL